MGQKISNLCCVNRAIKQGKEFVLGDSECTLSYAKKNGAIVVTFSGSDSVIKLIEQKYTVLVGSKGEENMYHFIAFADNEFSKIL